MAISLYSDHEFISLLDSIRLTGNQMRQEQKQLHMTKNSKQLRLVNTLQRDFDNLLNRANNMIANSNQIKIF